MWFAPYTEIGGEWINLPVAEVRNIQSLNKKGEFPPILVQEKKQLKTEKGELEFKNDMGTGSLTRLDERDRKRKGKGNNRPQGNQGPKNPNQNKVVQDKPQTERPASQERPATDRPQENRNRTPQNQRNNRPNRPYNNPNRNNPNKPKPENPA
jgi:hypothetical protein